MTKANVELSPCGKKVWVNDLNRCIARFSTVTGYDVSTTDGAIKTYKVGVMSPDDFNQFKQDVLDIHGVSVDVSVTFE